MNSANLYLFKFAWKSIQRNAGRSFFIGFSVSLAVVIAIWIVAIFDGMNHQIEEAVVNTNTGFYQLQEPHYAKTTDSSHPIPLTKSVIEKLSDKRIKAYSPELVLDSNISTPEGSASLLALGIVPELHNNILPLKDNMTSGEFIHDEDSDSVVIGESLAKQFQYSIGDQIVLNYQDIKGELRSELLTIKGIYHYNSNSFEKRYIYLSQKTWLTLFQNHTQDITLFNRIIINTKDLETGAFIKDMYPKKDFDVKTWKNLNPEMAVILEFHHGIIRFFLIIIGLTVTMTILTPVQMLWQERYKELKMLTILGVSVKKFWKLGLFEVIQMIAISALLSVISSVVVIGIQARTGLDFRFLNETGLAIERSGIKLPGIIYPLLSWDQIILTFVFVILVLGVSYTFSIYRTLSRFKVEL